MFKIGICDDETRVLDNVNNLIKNRNHQNEKVMLFSTPIDLLSYLKRGCLDILILDIMMENENGIEVAREIQEQYPGIVIIFQSGCLEFATEIYSVNTVYFLLKPIKTEKLNEALDIAEKHLEDSNREVLTLKFNREMIQVKTKDISYIESEKRSIHIHTKNKNITCLKKIDQVEEKLPDNFLRCHQSYLINMDYISVIHSDMLILFNEAEIPISRTLRKNVKERFLEYAGTMV